MFASSNSVSKKEGSKKNVFFYLLFLISLHHFEQVMTLANSRFAFNIAALMNRRGKIFHSTCIYEKTHFLGEGLEGWRQKEKRETI